MTGEERRILIAARGGRLHTNEHGRYVIDGEPRPDRKARENLKRWGFIAWQGGLSCQRWGITPAGESLLRTGEER